MNRVKTQAPPRFEEFLNTLRFELSLDLSPAEVDRIVVEARAHLHERADALVELGAPAHQAEADALAKFGDARRFALAMAEANGPPPQRLLAPVRHLAMTACLVAGITVLTCRSWHGGWVAVLPALLLVGIGAASFRARRPDFARLTRIGALASALSWFALSIGWVRVEQPGVFEITRRDQVPEAVKTMRDYANAFDREADRIALATEAFRHSSNASQTASQLGLAESGEILVPDRRLLETEGLLGRVDYHPESPPYALSAWRTQGALYAEGARNMGGEWRDHVRNLETASRQFGENFLRMWPWGAIAIPFVVLPLWIAHGLGLFIAWIVRIDRRRRRRTRHA